MDSMSPYPGWGATACSLASFLDVRWTGTLTAAAAAAAAATAAATAGGGGGRGGGGIGTVGSRASGGVYVAAVDPPLGAVPPHREPPTQEKGAKRGGEDSDPTRTPCSHPHLCHLFPRPRSSQEPGSGTPADRHPGRARLGLSQGGKLLLQIEAGPKVQKTEGRGGKRGGGRGTSIQNESGRGPNL
jgi:hypothetical protein